MKIIFILALLSLAASSSFALVDTCSQGYEQWQQWQQQQMLHPCRELLRQQCSTVALSPLVQPRMWQMSSCSVMRQQCCQQLRQMAQQSHCQAICTMAQSIMQQAAEFSGGYRGQTQAQAQAQAQEAMNLPSMCGIYPGHCSTPCSVSAVYGGCY